MLTHARQFSLSFVLAWEMKCEYPESWYLEGVKGEKKV